MILFLSTLGPLSSFVINKRGARMSVIIGGALSLFLLYFLMFSFGTVTGKNGAYMNLK